MISTVIRAAGIQITDDPQQTFEIFNHIYKVGSIVGLFDYKEDITGPMYLLILTLIYFLWCGILGACVAFSLRRQQMVNKGIMKMLSLLMLTHPRVLFFPIHCICLEFLHHYYEGVLRLRSEETTVQ